MTNKEKEQIQKSHQDEAKEGILIDFDEISIPSPEFIIDGVFLRLRSFNVLLAVLDHPCKDLAGDVRQRNRIVGASVLDHVLDRL